MDCSFQDLIHTVSNERCSPLLLPYKEEVIDAVLEQIEAQKKLVEELKQQQHENIHHKMCQAMELEILRWSYLIRVYLTTRFKKIQTLVGKLVVPIKDKLTRPEWEFCVDYQQAIEAALAGNEIEFTEEEEDLKPFVFFRALRDMGPTLFSSSETNEAMEIQKNQIYFARLEHVKPYIKDGRVVLV